MGGRLDHGRKNVDQLCPADWSSNSRAPTLANVDIDALQIPSKTFSDERLTAKKILSSVKYVSQGRTVARRMSYGTLSSSIAWR